MFRSHFLQIQLFVSVGYNISVFKVTIQRVRAGTGTTDANELKVRFPAMAQYSRVQALSVQVHP